MSRSVIRAAIVVFIASFCTLVVELVAGRVLAPYVGVSLYTWTSIIGVVLAGISGGAWAGGWLADRRPSESTLTWLLLASGIASLLIVPATNLLAGNDGILTGLGIATTLLQRVVVLSALLFFAPAFFLGMISPVAVKLAVRDLESTGRVVGRLYALSTLGSIAGTFTTGFYLVATFGTRATLIGTGIVLILTAVLLQGLFLTRTRLAAAVLLGVVWFYRASQPSLDPPPQAAATEPAGEAPIHFEESQYYTILVKGTVREDTAAPLRALHLDHLVHSYTDLADPAYLDYGYQKLFSQIVDWKARERRHFRLQFVGGGGYTLPRLVEVKYPGAAIDVVEIDPAVTRVAERYFGIPRDTAIRTANEDARWFAMRDGESYDAVFIDAFNDLSVPWHLTTREYTAALQGRLARGGVLAANLIDDFEDGSFLASYARTLQAVFGESNVAIVVEAEEDKTRSRSTFLVVATERLPSLLASLEPVTETMSVVTGAALNRYVAAHSGIVLTDDYAPVDNMLAPLFTDRFVDEVGE